MKKIIILFFTFFTFCQAVYATCSDVSREDIVAAAASFVEGNTYLVKADPDEAVALSDIPLNTTPNGGFDLPMWVVMVDETGKVCHVVNTGGEGEFVGNQSWLGSRVIAAQKANTANAFSLDYYAISTANLFGTVQDNNSLFGLQHSNPVDTKSAYSGNPKRYGTTKDPMKNRRVGGVNVFGGGLALYSGSNASDAVKIGAIGVSGDTSCTDHVVAWKIREDLGLDNVPRGPTTNMFNAQGGNPTDPSDEIQGGDENFGFPGAVLGDEMYIDQGNEGDTGWEHAACPNTPDFDKNGGAIIGSMEGVSLVDI
ncbi:MAG: heme-binding protein [Thiotrichaceae bacterium]|nr:heme-binding protein [Thiotrichaceae bacterium]